MAGLVEMAYQFQQLSTLGSVMPWLGLTLELDQPLHWMGMTLAALVWAGVWAVSSTHRRHATKEAQA